MINFIYNNAKIIILICLFVIVTLIINNEIIKGNMFFYSGKDNGFLVRIETITIMSMLYFFMLSKNKKILNLIIGFFIGILSSIISYFLSFAISYNPTIIFHVIAFCLFSLSYFLINKLRSTKTISN